MAFWPHLWERNLQKVSPPRPLFQLGTPIHSKLYGDSFLPQGAAAALRAIP
jgi:hypothetical protein